MKRIRVGTKKGSGGKTSSYSALVKDPLGTVVNSNNSDSGCIDTGTEGGFSNRSSSKEDELLSQLNSYIDGSSDTTSSSTSPAGSFYSLMRALAGSPGDSVSSGAAAQWAGLMDLEIVAMSNRVASFQHMQAHSPAGEVGESAVAEAEGSDQEGELEAAEQAYLSRTASLFAEEVEAVRAHDPSFSGSSASVQQQQLALLRDALFCGYRLGTRR
jgi:hypothetical protein